jgi:nitroimidazol reductase NimA-like FMN-containing flavoprotein (pyridoxamine 5'-phosphate oxidase superfamily)
MDALVVAKSAFHHSVNYRSVVIFAQAEKVPEPAQKEEALMWIVNKIVPNSWDYLRPIKENEVRKTTVLAFSLDEASAKLRSGMPIDDEEDMELPIWSGLIPLESKRGTPLPDASSDSIPLPDHLKAQ